MNVKKFVKLATVFIMISCLIASSVPMTFASEKNPSVKSVKVYDMECVEYSCGGWDYDYNEETGDWDLEYYYYFFEPEFEVTLTDGTVLESENGGLEYNGEYYFVEYELEQGYNNELSVGTYIIEATLMGYRTSFKVSIIESPVKSVEIYDIECIQYTNGVWDYDYNEETNAYDLEYFYYYFNPEFIVTLKDDTVLTSENGYVEYNGENYCVEYYLYQDFENQLGLGTHTIEATVMECETSFDVSIIETPVQSVQTKDLNYTQYTNGFWTADYNFETGECDLEYFCYQINPEFTVTLKNGTVLKSKDGSVEYNNEIYSMSCNIYQNYDNQLGVGEYTVKAYVLGYETSYVLSISEGSGAQLGDVNGDGDVTIDDVTSIQMYLSGIISLTDAQLAVADVNGDSDITVDDATVIQMYLAGIISSY